MIDIKKLKSMSSTMSVLYVEDDDAIQKSMQLYLSKFFKSVDIANNGQEGLSFYKENNSFDLVITDLSMPKMNGIDMINRIKEINEEQCVLITTAHSESDYLLGAMKSHIDGYIVKPFNFDELNFELYKITEKIYTFKENENYKVHLEEMLILQTQGIQENYEKTLLSMVELIEHRDTYTAGHSKRVAYYSEIIAREMGLSEEECHLVHQAGIMHDIGKIETPDAVLLKPARLTALEYTLIQEHVAVGYNLLNSIPMFKTLAPIVHAHHERYDGSGYPNGLKGEEINKLARIMMVADAFDAMTTNRIYKGRKSVEEGIKELVSLVGSQFHPEVVQSAKKVLKNIKLDENINQLPKTKLEKERFAYFYKDRVTSGYNQDYLELILLKNSGESMYRYMLILSINNFSSYNKKNSWKDGDILLKKFADILIIHFENEYVFRIFGDDFVVLSKEKIEVNSVKKVLDSLMIENNLNYRTFLLDLNIQKIQRLKDIEAIY
ncbi:response regulator [Sulfurimonas sp. SAG-AH-194-L11]|nr:HD domain-containing phosphohydrolase [Sulfurimonas sp. SAG-AH-194-L11]MDF1876337.1 response regulator [Sulfurimonas sp. SAG-AH-194-L11]